MNDLANRAKEALKKIETDSKLVSSPQNKKPPSKPKTKKQHSVVNSYQFFNEYHFLQEDERSTGHLVWVCKEFQKSGWNWIENLKLELSGRSANIAIRYSPTYKFWDLGKLYTELVLCGQNWPSCIIQKEPTKLNYMTGWIEKPKFELVPLPLVNGRTCHCPSYRKDIDFDRVPHQLHILGDPENELSVDLHFTRFWLDRIIEAESACLWNHVYKGEIERQKAASSTWNDIYHYLMYSISDKDAVREADIAAAEFEEPYRSITKLAA